MKNLIKSLFGGMTNAARWTIAKVFAALGLGFISFAGFLGVVNYLADEFVHRWTGMPADTLNLLLIAGFGEAAGYIFGAYIFVFSIDLGNKLVTGLTK